MSTHFKRNLFLTNTSVEEALAQFLSTLQLDKPKAKTIKTTQALGRVTAAPVFALNNSPLYDCAAMDGIAVSSQKTIGASENAPLTLKLGEDYIQVDTGDPIKPPFDAVIMAEELFEGEGDDEIIIRQSASPWQHLRPVGEDIVKSEMILPSNHKIRPIDIGVLLSGGITQLEVLKKPSIAIIPTGSELIEAGAEIGEDSIIESNSYMLASLVENEGCTPNRHNIVADDYDAIKKALFDGVDNNDAVLICSGTSAGREDYSIHALRELGEVVIHGVAMKPGKPVILAIVKGKPVIGVPGYPVSAFIAYENFAKPILNHIATGSFAKQDNIVQARLTRRLVSSFKHKEYVRVKVGRVGGDLVATPLARGAGAAMSLVRADGFCIIEQEIEGLEAGSLVNVALCRPIEDLEQTVVSIGSHDLMLDIVADMMPSLYNSHFSSSHTGSLGGLMALKNNEAHIAPIHQLDEASGTYNIPIVKQLLKDRKMALIKGVGRVQGIMVKKGNPLNIQGLEDLPKHRYINRQRGAGTRVLLDFKLKQAGISPADIKGYEREAQTSMAVAAAILGDSADCGMGIMPVANTMGLDFIVIDKEEYDFAVPVEFLELPHIKAFIETLKNPTLHAKLEAIGGYDVGGCGEVVLID
ncbi:MAG: molybdopterin biosynthesis protein [Defluviitaleaceae bacterium]|nr:molybdopterin biosynthesis protein [Defluviitaleaceae bacterium]